jgi:hypothetical protein
MNFRVGQKVVCIATKWAIPDEVTTAPQKGAVYTIRHIGQTRGLYSKRLCGIGLLLEEIVNPPLHWAGGGERGYEEIKWAADMFRPLVDTERSTETGFKILDDVRKKQISEVIVRRRATHKA